MEFTVKPVGSSVDELVSGVIRSLTAANRTVGREIAKVGKKAILDSARQRRGTLSFGGGKLGVKAKAKPSAQGCEVILQGFSVGAWTIQETGTKAHDIYHNKKKALHFLGIYADNVYVQGIRGRRLWSGAQPALDEAVRKVIDDVYDEALEV